MNIEKWQIELPKEFSPYISDLKGASLDEKIRIALALELFSDSKIKMETAALLSGQSPAHFAEISRSLRYH